MAFCSCGSVQVTTKGGAPICARTKLAPSECLAVGLIHAKLSGRDVWTRPNNHHTRRPRLDAGDLGR
jgi:hypothetical protein